VGFIFKMLDWHKEERVWEWGAGVVKSWDKRLEAKFYFPEPAP